MNGMGPPAMRVTGVMRRVDDARVMRMDNARVIVALAIVMRLGGRAGDKEG